MADKEVMLAAAIMTLSEGVDAMYRAMRQTLSYQVTETGHKIPETFLPGPLEESRGRFERWKGELEKS